MRAGHGRLQPRAVENAPEACPVCISIEAFLKATMTTR
jgi:hypothetical protein